MFPFHFHEEIERERERALKFGGWMPRSVKNLDMKTSFFSACIPTNVRKAGKIYITHEEKRGKVSNMIPKLVCAYNWTGSDE